MENNPTSEVDRRLAATKIEQAINGADERTAEERTADALERIGVALELIFEQLQPIASCVRPGRYGGTREWDPAFRTVTHE